MELKPRIGADKLRFGMKRKEIIALLGEPDQIVRDEYGRHNDRELILDWNKQKLRLTFNKKLEERLVYLQTKNRGLTYNGQKIMDRKIETVKSKVFGNLIHQWDPDYYVNFTTYFNEEYWLSLHVEFGVVTNVEVGVPFHHREAFDWPIDLTLPLN